MPKCPKSAYKAFCTSYRQNHGRKNYLADQATDVAGLRIMSNGFLELQNWSFLLGQE